MSAPEFLAEIKAELLVQLMGEYGGVREDWTELRSLSRVAAAVEQIASAHAAAAVAAFRAEAVAAIEAARGIPNRDWFADIVRALDP